MSKERDFWLKEATLDDIAGVPPVNLKACLDAIIPEIEPAIAEVGYQVPIILDIGCGPGRLAIPIQKHFKKAQVLGIDINEEFLKLAAEKSKKMKPAPIFHKSGGTKIPDNQYSAIYSMLVIQHLPHNIAYGYILEAGQKLHMGGRLRFQYVEGNIDHDNNHQLSRMQVERWVKDAGLKILKIDEGLVHHQWNWITAEKVRP